MYGWFRWEHNSYQMRWEFVQYRGCLVIGRRVTGWIVDEVIYKDAQHNIGAFQEVVKKNFGMRLPLKAFL